MNQPQDDFSRIHLNKGSRGFTREQGDSDNDWTVEIYITMSKERERRFLLPFVTSSPFVDLLSSSFPPVSWLWDKIYFGALSPSPVLGV